MVRTELSCFWTSVASIKTDERSEFRVAFDLFKIHKNIKQKIAPGTERKRSSIEFERSENIGQFLKKKAFNYF